MCVGGGVLSNQNVSYLSCGGGVTSQTTQGPISGVVEGCLVNTHSEGHIGVTSGKKYKEGNV